MFFIPAAVTLVGTLAFLQAALKPRVTATVNVTQTLKTVRQVDDSGLQNVLESGRDARDQSIENVSTLTVDTLDTKQIEISNGTGTAGQIIVFDGTDLIWQDAPGSVLDLAGVLQNGNNGANQDIRLVQDFQTPQIDAIGNFINISSDQIIKVLVDGNDHIVVDNSSANPSFSITNDTTTRPTKAVIEGSLTLNPQEPLDSLGTATLQIAVNATESQFAAVTVQKIESSNLVNFAVLDAPLTSEQVSGVRLTNVNVAATTTGVEVTQCDLPSTATFIGVDLDASNITTQGSQAQLVFLDSNSGPTQFGIQFQSLNTGLIDPGPPAFLPRVGLVDFGSLNPLVPINVGTLNGISITTSDSSSITGCLVGANAVQNFTGILLDGINAANSNFNGVEVRNNTVTQFSNVLHMRSLSSFNNEASLYGILMERPTPEPPANIYMGSRCTGTMMTSAQILNDAEPIFFLNGGNVVVLNFEQDGTVKLPAPGDSFSPIYTVFVLSQTQTNLITLDTTASSTTINGNTTFGITTPTDPSPSIYSLTVQGVSWYISQISI